ncbi:MAG: hypothetical protein WB770_06490 [Acidimicrobiales bacterium]
MRGKRALSALVGLHLAAGGGAVVLTQPFASAAPKPVSGVHADARAGEASCVLNGPKGPVRHVIEITFDNVHYTRDNANVPSDLEQIPSLLNFIKQNGVILINEHTPLIAHTADDILTTLTGVYGSTQVSQ